jgi:hypothetical protein
MPCQGSELFCVRTILELEMKREREIMARLEGESREMRDAHNHRLRLVAAVRTRGIKSTARLFATSTLTVRK